MSKHCGERLLVTMTGYPKEALLHAPVSRTQDYLIVLGDYVLNREVLINRANLSKELAHPVCPRRASSWWTTVHCPSRSGHLADLLYLMFVDEFEPSASDGFVLYRGYLHRGHYCVSFPPSSDRNWTACKLSSLMTTEHRSINVCR